VLADRFGEGSPAGMGSYRWSQPAARGQFRSFDRQGPIVDNIQAHQE